MFAVDDVDATLERLRTHGAQLLGEVVQYKDVYPICYISGPEGIPDGDRWRREHAAGTERV